MPILTLSLLGGFRAHLDDRPLSLSKKAQALLAHVSLSPGLSQTRARLAGLLWGDRADEQARNSLRQTLFELRRVLGPAGEGRIAGDHDRVTLDAEGLSVDVLDFERLAGEAGLSALERAASLYGGELLAGLWGMGPEGDGSLSSRELDGERGAPGAGAHHPHLVGHSTSMLSRGAGFSSAWASSILAIQ